MFGEGIGLLDFIRILFEMCRYLGWCFLLLDLIGVDIVVNLVDYVLMFDVLMGEDWFRLLVVV